MRFPNTRQLQGRAKRRTQLASDLYDTGKPKRIIVEHEVRHTHEVVRSEDYNGFCRALPVRLVGHVNSCDTNTEHARCARSNQPRSLK